MNKPYQWNTLYSEDEICQHIEKNTFNCSSRFNMLELGFKLKQYGLYSNCGSKNCAFDLIETDKTFFNCPSRFFLIKILDYGEYRKICGRLCFSDRISGLIRLLIAEIILLLINPRAFGNLGIQLLIILLLFSFWLVQGITGCFVHRKHERKMVAQIDQLFKEIQIPNDAD